MIKTHKNVFSHCWRYDCGNTPSIIEIEIKFGSDVVCDCWKSYTNLHKYVFQHFTVNHKKNFVDNQTKNTQKTLKIYGCLLKKMHSDYGINRNTLQKHLEILCWREIETYIYSIYFLKQLLISKYRYLFP